MDSINIMGIYVARPIVQMCAAVVMALSVYPGVQASDLMLALGRLPSNHDSAAMAGAEVRTCKVTSIHDGDSMRVRCPGYNDTLRIRLDQIDAPELDQDHGKKSRDHLRSLCPIGKTAIVHDLGRDNYNRRLGRLFCNDVDVNAAMIESGSAWVYDYHATDKNLSSLQDKARSAKRGLWSARKKPVPPWDFRYQQRR